MGSRRERRRQDDQTAHRIVMARVLIQEVDERWHGLARYLSNSGLDHNDDLIARRARYIAEARAGGVMLGKRRQSNIWRSQ